MSKHRAEAGLYVRKRDSLVWRVFVRSTLWDGCIQPSTHGRRWVADGRYLLRTVLAAGARADQASTGLGLEGCVARDAWLGNAGDGPHGNNSMTASSIPLSTFLPFSSPQVPRNPDLSFGPTLCSVSLWDPSNGHMLIALSCFLDCLPLVPPAVRYIIIILRCW